MAIRQFRPVAALASAILILGAVACSDSVADPASPASATSLKAAGPHFTYATTSVTTTTLYPQYDNVYVSAEGHRIVIPAYSICNPATSGYGPSLWDAPCSPATTPIAFTITTSVNEKGLSRVTVSPDVRFVPTKTVMAYLKDATGAQTPGAVIAYCNLLGCSDEGKTDPAMATYRDAAQGYVYRRLKHFSGYNVVFGFACDPATDPNCVDGGTVTSKAAPMPFGNFSGYITTIGHAGNEQD